MTSHYTLRLFEGDNPVATSIVGIVPGTQSFPTVGQTIGGKWKVTEILRNSESKIDVRFERLQGPNRL